MKKILLTLFIAGTFFAANAQTTATTAPQLSKEEKAKIKAQQDADITSSFKDAGLTDDQATKAKAVIVDANAKNNELKKNTVLTDADKEIEKKKNNDDKNAKLKEIMGDKYKAWTAIRKKQKEASTPNQ